MEFSILETLSPSEQKEWDVFVGASAHAHFLQRSAWGRLQAAETGKKSFYLIGRDRGTLGVAALFLKRALFGISKGTYESPCGPVFSDSASFSEALRFLDDQLGRRAMSIEINPRWTMDESGLLRQALAEHGYTPIPDPRHERYHAQTLVVDLRPPLETILQSFRDTTRHEIAKAEKAGVKVEFFNTREATRRFFDLYERHAQARGMAAKNKAYFDLLQDHVLADPANGFVALATLNDELLSGGVFFMNGRRAWYTYGASSPALKKQVPTSHLLHWRVMQKVKGVGGEVYDLGGALELIDKTDPTYGVTLFKRGFSDTFVTFLPSFIKEYSPFLMTLLRWKRRLR